MRENNKSLINIIYHNLACIYGRMQCYEKAFTYFDLAAEQIKGDTETDLFLFLDIAYTLLLMGNKDEAMEKAKEGLKLAKKTKDKKKELLFEMINHMNNLEDEASLSYAEKTGIPALINEGMYLKAIEYCNLLSNFYDNKNTRVSLKRALEYCRMAEDLYRKIMRGGEMI